MTTLSLPDLFTPATAEQWYAVLLANADKLKLRTTDWSQGGVTRTTFAVFANVLMLGDVAVSLLNQGGFLDYAASGTVTYTDPVTLLPVVAYVTPDPSIPAQNPDGSLGALDVLADSVYDVRRTLSTAAGGQIAILNTSGLTYGPYVPGTYHVAQPGAAGNPAYSNAGSQTNPAAALSIPPSAIAGTAITGATNATPIEVTTSAAHGLVTGDAVFVAGVLGNTAANGAWYVVKTSNTKVTLTGSAGNSGYVSGGHVYVPTLAQFEADTAGTASNAVAANLITQNVTALVGVSVANLAPFLGSDIQSNVDLAATCRLKLQSLSPNGPKGAYLYFSLQAKALAPTLTPPLAVAAAVTRARVVADPLSGKVTATLASSVGGLTGDTSTPGTDVYAVYQVLQAYCVPEGITLVANGAVDHNVAALVNVWVPSAYDAAIKTVAELAVQTFFQLLAIGGVTDTSGAVPNTNVVPFNAVLGSVFTAATANGIPLQNAELTLDGATLNVELSLTPIPEIAVLTPSTGFVTTHLF